MIWFLIMILSWHFDISTMFIMVKWFADLPTNAKSFEIAFPEKFLDDLKNLLEYLIATPGVDVWICATRSQIRHYKKVARGNKDLTHWINESDWFARPGNSATSKISFEAPRLVSILSSKLLQLCSIILSTNILFISYHYSPKSLMLFHNYCFMDSLVFDNSLTIALSFS